RLLEVEPADDVAQGRGGELLDRAQVVRDLVGRRTGVGDLEVDDGVDRDDEVVFGDDRLRRERHHLLAHVDERTEPIDEGDQEIQPRAEGLVVPAQPLDDARGRLRDDPDRADHHDQGEDDDRGGEGPSDRLGDDVVHALSSSFSSGRGVATNAVAPSMRVTVTVVPGGSSPAAVRAVQTSPFDSFTWPDVVETVAITCPASPLRAATVDGVGSSPRCSRRSSGGLRTRMSRIATTAALITCSHNGAPSRSEASPATPPMPSMRKVKSRVSASMVRKIRMSTSHPIQANCSIISTAASSALNLTRRRGLQTRL